MATDILAAFVTTDRQGDAFKAMNRLTQGRRPLHAYHLQVNKALREYADAFNRAYDPEQALFQYWESLTNKHLVGFLRQYHSTTFPKPTLEDVMRRASEYTAYNHPAVHPEGHPGQEFKPKRRRDGDDGGAAGTGSSFTPKRTSGMTKRGTSFKEGKSPAKKSGGSQAGGKGGSQSQGPGSMSAARVWRLRSDKGLLKNSTSSSTALRRPEARRNAGSFVKTIRALIARSPDIRTGNARHPGTGPRKATLLKVRDLPRKRTNDGVYPRQGLPLPRGPVKILYLIPGQKVHEIFRRPLRKPRKQGPRPRTSCSPVTIARR